MVDDAVSELRGLGLSPEPRLEKPAGSGEFVAEDVGMSCFAEGGRRGHAVSR